MKNPIINALFDTRAIRVCSPEEPFWYTSGLFGPYYVNTHFYSAARKRPSTNRSKRLSQNRSICPSCWRQSCRPMQRKMIPTGWSLIAVSKLSKISNLILFPVANGGTFSFLFRLPRCWKAPFDYFKRWQQLSN